MEFHTIISRIFPFDQSIGRGSDILRGERPPIVTEKVSISRISKEIETKAQ